MSDIIHTTAHTGVDISGEYTVATRTANAGEHVVPGNIFLAMSGLTSSASDYTVRVALDGVEYTSDSFTVAGGKTTANYASDVPLYRGVTTFTVQGPASDTSVNITSTLYDATEGPNVSADDVPSQLIYTFSDRGSRTKAISPVVIENSTPDGATLQWDLTNILGDGVVTEVVDVTFPSTSGGTFGAAYVTTDMKRVNTPISGLGTRGQYVAMLRFKTSNGQSHAVSGGLHLV